MHLPLLQCIPNPPSSFSIAWGNSWQYCFSVCFHNTFKYPTPSATFETMLTYDKVHNCTIPCDCRTKRYLNFQTCSEHVLRAKAAWTFSPASKCGLRSSILYTFDSQMRPGPLRPALFRHLNFQRNLGMRCFVYFDFDICQMAPHPPL